MKLPNEPTADQQTVIDKLNNLSGAEFDKAWVTAELAGHVQAIQATQTEISQGSEQSVVQLAQDGAAGAAGALRRAGGPGPAVGHPGPADQRQRHAQPGWHRQPGSAAAPGGTESPAPGGTESPAPGGTTTESPAPGGDHRDAGSEHQLT